MRERLRLLLAACFYYSGLVSLANKRLQRSTRRLIILNYHSAAGENLRQQMRYLSRHFRVMHLEDALEELFQPPQKELHDKRIPVVLTFDDGYLDNSTYGLQLAREYNVPFTVFLIPGYIESGTCFWWLAGESLLNRTQVEKVTIEEQTYSLPTERQAVAAVIDRHLRCAESVKSREIFLTQVQDALHVALPTRLQEGNENTLLPLNWDEIHEMQASGLVSFGAHTMHHPVLGHVVDANEVLYEVGEARRVLEQHLGQPVRTFAYPIGKIKDIGDTGLSAVSAAGYTWALTTIEELNTPQTHPHLLCRLPGDTSQHWLIMASELAGLLGIISKLRRKKNKP
jgi:peptidoglycan/xylan/chitin deacetylase (PgdA/CDA1 family)